MKDSPAQSAPQDGWATPLVSAGLWAAGLTWLALTLPPLTLLLRAVGPDRAEPLVQVYIRGQLALTLCRWRAVVDPSLDPNGRYLFVQNHVNLLDHVTMYPATPHFKQGMELLSHFDIPFYGWFMRARGTIPVERDKKTALLALRRAMKAELAKGHSLLAFPEGTRTRDGHVAPFHEGLFHLARALEVPVVPVAVTGMWSVMPTGSWRFRPFQTVTVHVMAPIPTAGLSRDAVSALAQSVRAQIAERVDASLREAA